VAISFRFLGDRNHNCNSVFDSEIELSMMMMHGKGDE
jgi:hypothetical protein